MKKGLTLLFYIVICHSFAQNCDIELRLNEIVQLNKVGRFDVVLSNIDSLLGCNNVTKDQKISLGIWEYKMFRNKFKAKKGNASLLKTRSFLEKNNLSLNLDFQLLLAESYALMKETNNFQRVIKKIEGQNDGDWLNIINNDSLYQGRYLYIKYLNIDQDIYPEKAIKLLQRSFSLFEASDNVPIYYLGNSLRGLGNLYRTNGDFDKSISYYQRELELYETSYNSDHFNIAVAHYNLGSVFYEKLEYQNAIDHYLKTYKVWTQIYNPSDTYMRNLNEAIGDLYWELGDKVNALNYFNNTIIDEKKINNDISEEVIKKGDSLSKKGDYSIAMNYYLEAFKWREKTFGKEHLLTGACKNFVARAIYSSGNIKEALDAYQEAINILVEEMTEPSWYLNPTLDMKIQSHQYLIESLIAKGELLYELYHQTNHIDDLKASLDTFESALMVLEDMKNGKMSESSKVFWTKRTLSLIENGIKSAMLLNQQTEDVEYIKIAFNFSERSKALLLLTSLSDHQISSFVNVDKEILNKEIELKNNINEYMGRIESEEKRCSVVREKMLTLWKNELQSLQNEYAILINDIEERFPDYYHLKYDLQIASLNSIQEHLLDENTILISYFAGEQEIYVFKITSYDISIRNIKDSQRLYQQFSSFYKSIIEPKKIQKDPQKAYEDYTNMAYRLYEQLLNPELDGITQQKLIIIPDGILSYIPYEILLTNKYVSSERDYRSLPYVLNNFSISYNPSASIGFLSYANNSSNDQYMGFAPDYLEQYYSDSRKTLSKLKYNDKEVDHATKLFNGNSWIGKDVNEDLLKDNSNKAGILHLAMHGEVEDKHPLLSKLYFNSSDAEDGILHIYEIYNLKIPAQLVILSACNTATGKLERGEGILSLERAFQYAGSKSIVSTLWTVDDESSSIINQLFLENIKNGVSKDLALQDAKKKYLSSSTPDKLHPYFWSSFRLTGNTEPFVKKSKTLSIFIVGIIAILVIVLIRKKKLKKLLSFLF